jgi:hypothetical protein
VRIVDLLRERLFAGLGADDVIADRGYIRALSEPRRDFLVNWREARIDMMETLTMKCFR